MAEILQLNDTSLLREVESRSGTKVSACFQCHKCSSGCPVGSHMDLLPSQIMRLIQLGEEAELLGSHAIWLCASCQVCTTRCPQEIDIAAVMDTLRIMAVERKLAPPEARAKHFNRSFLSSVRRNGRVFEAGMMAFYKLRSGDWFGDFDKVPKMLAKGKLTLLPKRGGATKQVREVFRRAEDEENEQ